MAASVEEVHDLLLPLVVRSACLPYPIKGGLRKDLALASKKWYAALNDQKKVSHKMLVAGLLQTHKTRKENNPDWDMTDAKSASWAGQVATNTFLLKRRVASNGQQQKTRRNGLR